MPVFFWTIGLWKTPLSACLRLFRDADNEVLPEPTPSTEDLLSLDDSFSPWRASAKRAADLARAKASADSDSAPLPPHLVPSHEEGDTAPEEGAQAVFSPHPPASSPRTPRTVRLSPAHLHTIIAFHPAKAPLPLTYAAAHPLCRLVAEQTRGLYLPHGTTRLEQTETPDVDPLAAPLGIAELTDRLAPSMAPVRHATRTVQAGSLAGLAAYVAVAEWWWGRPLHRAGAGASPPSSSTAPRAVTVPLALVVRRRRQRPEYGAALPEINRNRAVPLATSKNTSAKSAQAAALGAAGNAELAHFVDAFGNWRSHTVRGAVPDGQTPTIERLTMEGFDMQDTLPLTRATAFLHVRVLSLKRCQGVVSVAAFGRLPHLQELDLSLSGVARLDGLERSTSLHTVKVASCLQLQSLSPLGAVSSLRCLVASQSAVYDVSGLAQSRSLLSVKLYGCLELTDVSALGAIPTLQELAASESNVVVMDGLAQSPSLRLLGLRYCDLTDLTPLAPLSTLEVLNVSCTPIRSVEPLQTCTRLRQLAISGCAQLRSLSALGVLPHLEAIDASNSAVEDVSGLRTAAALQKLNLTNCWRLGAVGALGHCPALAVLHMTSSGVDGLAGLEQSRSLCTLDLSYCKRLTEADVPSVRALRPLEMLNVTGCTALKHYLTEHEASIALLQERHHSFLYE